MRSTVLLAMVVVMSGAAGLELLARSDAQVLIELAEFTPV